MGKPLVGPHLMRVRIRRNIFDRLQNEAKEQSDLSGEHITVSDLVRSACYNYLLIQDSLRQLENAPPLIIEGEVLFIATPMLD